LKTKQNENKAEPILYAIQWKNEKIIDNEFVFDSFDDAKDYLLWEQGIDKRTSFRDTFIVPLYKDVKEGSVYKFSCCAIQWSGENKPDNEFVFDSFEDAEHYCDYDRPRCIIPLYRSILDTFSL
jgi:hypothetical protein